MNNNLKLPEINNAAKVSQFQPFSPMNKHKMSPLAKVNASVDLKPNLAALREELEDLSDLDV